MPGGRPKSDEKQRFLAKIEMMETGCHEWRSTLHRDGYGKFYHDGKQVQAHRVAYELFKAPIPDGLFVLHRCDNRKCVNPEHLFLGTQRENIEDREQKGRTGRSPRPNYRRLTDEQVQEIYGLLDDRYSQREVSERFGVHQSTISRYRRSRQPSVPIG